MAMGSSRSSQPLPAAVWLRRVHASGTLAVPGGKKWKPLLLQGAPAASATASGAAGRAAA